jgi:preprotein translocase subunit SecA
MFVDLMNDVYNTFAERLLRVQLVFEPMQQFDTGAAERRPEPQRPTKRYNALGILEDVPVEEPSGNGDGVVDIAPSEPPKKEPTARKEPLVVGAGRTRTLGSQQPAPRADWSTVGRNDPCPCGSGKKFKKCHGANA